MSTEQEFDSNFRYVMVAARRARQLQNGSPPLVSSRSGKACRVAQDEIAAGKVGYIRSETPVLKPEVAAPEIPKFAIS
jgi:DNA-directed RNA polymerase subunit omega